jgi:hypothetical protein
MTAWLGGTPVDIDVWFSAVIGLAGTVLGALAGGVVGYRSATNAAEVTGKFALLVARENRQASDQQPALRELQDQVAKYMSVVSDILWGTSAEWRPGRDYLPPPLPIPYGAGPVLPAHPEEWMRRRAQDAWLESIKIASELDMLKERIASEVIRREIAALLAIDWVDKAAISQVEAYLEYENRRVAINVLIGGEYRRY